MNTRSHGFSLIELMIVITIIALLVLLGVPSYRQWILNTRIRTTAEGIQNGLRNARMQAIQQDKRIRFELTSGTSANWTICAPAEATPATCSGGTTTQSYVSDDGKSGVLLGSLGNSLATPFGTPITSFGAGGVTFTPMGRPDPNDVSTLRVDVYSTQSGARRLVNTVSANGQARMCDPQLSQATSPQGC